MTYTSGIFHFFFVSNLFVFLWRSKNSLIWKVLRMTNTKTHENKHSLFTCVMWKGWATQTRMGKKNTLNKHSFCMYYVWIPKISSSIWVALFVLLVKPVLQEHSTWHMTQRCEGGSADGKLKKTDNAECTPFCLLQGCYPLHQNNYLMLSSFQ